MMVYESSVHDGILFHTASIKHPRPGASDWLIVSYSVPSVSASS